MRWPLPLPLLSALVAFLLPLPLLAQSLPRFTPSPTGGTLTPGSLSDIGSGYRGVSANQSIPGETLISDRVRAGVGAANADMYVNRAISFRNALAIGARALPYVGAAALGYDIYTRNRCTVSGSGLQCLGPEAQPTSYIRNMGTAPYGGYETMPEWAAANTSRLNSECAQTYGPGSVVTGWVVAGSNELRVSCTGGGAASNPFADVQGSTLTPDQVADLLLPFADPAKAADIVRGALSTGQIDLAPYAMPRSATGPASLGGPTVETVTTPAPTVENPNPAPVTVTSTTVYNITYSGDTFTYTTVVQNPAGAPGTGTPTEPTPEVCGGPGLPACNVKVDESGTPAATSPDLSVFEALKNQDAQNVSEALSSVPEPSFGFIGAPPIVACRPVPLPNEMGEIDACNVVDTVRELMGFLWALAAAWISLGWIREAVNGG